MCPKAPQESANSVDTGKIAPVFSDLSVPGNHADHSSIMHKDRGIVCPATKSGGVLCYTLRTFECLSVRPSVRQRLIIHVRSITLIPFKIISRNLAQM